MSTPSSFQPGPPARRNTTTLESAPPSEYESPQAQGVTAGSTSTADAQPPHQGARRRGTAGSSLGPGQQGGVKRKLTELFVPEHKLAEAPTYTSSFKHAFLSSWVNVLLIFIPISWAAHFAGLSDTLIFVFSFFAIIPLASLLSFATEELALRVGQTLGGLLNATLGNAVELIVTILALIKCNLTIVQSSLVGSILSNMLLVLGMSFFVGGLKYAEQTVASTAAQLNSSLLQMSVYAILLPSAFHFAIGAVKTAEVVTEEDQKQEILSMSRGTAVILLVIYVAYLVFQLWSHVHLYADAEGPTQSTQYPDEVKAGARKAARFGMKERAPKTPKEKSEGGGFMSKFHLGSKKDHVDGEGNDVSARTTATEHDQNHDLQATTHSSESQEEEEEDEEVPQLNLTFTVGLLVLTTVVVGVTAEWLVSSIEGLTQAHPQLSEEWVGLILLPIAGNAAEHVTAVFAARKDKLDLATSVAIGSSIQIALFVIPFMVVLAWIMGKPLTMLFDPFETIVLFLSVLIVNSTLSDSRSNWLEGWILMMCYLLLAVAFWYYPGSEPIITCY